MTVITIEDIKAPILIVSVFVISFLAYIDIRMTQNLCGYFLIKKRLTVCVTCVWAGVDNAWEQEKLEARKMLENAAESHTSGARFVGQFYGIKTTFKLSNTTPTLGD